jgi:type VI secretion system protein ImpL
LFLVVGLEGAGKTAVLQNSGIEPSLLAGQVLGSGTPITSTRVANVWLAHESIFVEMSGRVFNSEPGRLAEFVSVLQPGGRSRGWMSWFQLFRKPISLRGVLLCIDSRNFAGAPEPASLDRAAQKVRERLLAISESLGIEFPVYVLLTNLDGLPYFAEYFAHLSEDESGQVFGVLRDEKPVGENEKRVWADAETRRLNRAFQSLFGRLSDRRLLTLTVEPDPSHKPAAYEFPREFKRIRPALVQFLVDVFKPDPLKLSPRLRGFFFVGTKKVERVLNPGDAKSTYSSQRKAFDATQIFKPGMRVPSGDPSVLGKSAASSAGQLADRWVFLTELFHRVLPGDRPPIANTSGRTRLDPHRKYVLGGAVALAGFLIFVWTFSWIGNWRLSGRVGRAVNAAQTGDGTLSLQNLQTLGRLRDEIERLEADRSLILHWGLYQGDTLLDVAQRAYFERLKQLSLDGINRVLAGHLEHASSEAQSAAATRDRLETHRTITAGCSVDRPLISRVLKMTAVEVHPELSGEQLTLLQSQLDFYAGRFERNKQPPVKLAEKVSAVEEARNYLRSMGGLDQQLQSIVRQLNQQVKSASVTENTEDYRLLLKGNAEVIGAFTKAGYDLFDGLAAKVGNSGGDDSCVMGNSERVEAVGNVLDPRTRDQLKSLYLLQYAKAWKEFLASYSVIPYRDAHDGAVRLGKLSASSSPLLAVVHLVATNTNFPAPKPGELGLVGKGAQALGLSRVAKADKALAEGKQLLEKDTRITTPAYLTQLFQPVLFTSPPEDGLVNDHDRSYIEGLRKLQEGLYTLVQASPAEKPTAISGAHAAFSQAQRAHLALADQFRNAADDGLSKQLTDLLEQPIHLAEPLVPINADRSIAATKNGELALFCREMSPILRKYPFNPANPIGASITDLSNGFEPGRGKVWKYALEKGADLVVRNTSSNKWERNQNWQGPRVTQDLVNFLDRAQELSTAMFTDAGMLQPKLRYILRPTGSQPVRLVLDGTDLRSSESALQKTFYWPAQDDNKQGAEGTVDVRGGAGFGKFVGLWGVFRLFQTADERVTGQKFVQWSVNRGGGGAQQQKIDPPAKVEFVRFPADVDLFNPRFFESLSCPGKAVTPN